MMRRLLLGIGIVIGLGALWFSIAHLTVKARSTKLETDANYLFSAFQEYREHVGAFPFGSNAQIARMLNGQNPKKVIIVVGRKIAMNEKGEFVDPWGTPLRIYFSTQGMLIRSAGPNKRFEDSDVQDGDDFFRSTGTGA